MDFDAHWKSLLEVNGRQPVDVIASLTERGINHFLDEHFKNDSDKYSVVIKRVFDDHGTDRKFTLTLTAEAPIEIDVFPFVKTAAVPWSEYFGNAKDWIVLEEKGKGCPDERPIVSQPRIEPTKGKPDTRRENLRVICSQFRVKLTWPKLKSPGEEWEWEIKGLKLVAEAQLRLAKKDGKYQLEILPTLIKLDQKVGTLARGMYKEFLASHGREVEVDEQKFVDLLIIGFNIATTQLAPGMIQAINIPVPVVAEKPIYPTFLDLSDDKITFGAGLDAAELYEEFRKEADASIGHISNLIEEDIVDNGGLTMMVYGRDDFVDIDDFRAATPLSKREIRNKFERTNEYVGRLKRNVESVIEFSAYPELEATEVTVPKALAAGLNEHFLDTIAKASLPDPKGDCKEERIGRILKGKACWWLRLPDADTTIQGTKVSGSVRVDVGGSLEGCVRRIFDCKERWDCARLSMAIVGDPGVEIEFKKGKKGGIAFTGQVKLRGLKLVTNLPWPFDEVANEFNDVFVWFVESALNFLLDQFTFEFIPPIIELDGHKTKIQLHGFVPFPVVRSLTGIRERDTYLGFSCGVTAKD